MSKAAIPEFYLALAGIFLADCLIIGNLDDFVLKINFLIDQQ